MRGRPGCPTGQEKNSVGATGGSPLFSTRKGWVQGRPLIRPSVRTGAPSPRGEGFALCFPSRLQNHPLPARPAGGRAVTGVGSWAAGQAEKKRTPYRILQTRVGSPEGRNSPLWPSFPPFLGRNGGPRRVGALRGAAPRGLGKAPPTRRVRSTAIPPRQARAPTKQGPSFFAQFCATFLPPPCTPACNFGPGSPGGERRFCHAHPP